MNFLPGFTWALPDVFSDAVSKCRFEEGDILYNSESAYGLEWAKAMKTTTACIKVRAPRRSASKASEKNESVFRTHWNSDAVIEFINFRISSVESRFIETTQGRLFTCLWKGTTDILGKTGKNPEIPLILKEVKNKLNKLFNARKWRTVISGSQSLDENRDYFILPYDPTHALSQKKHVAICNALGKNTDGEIANDTMEAIGFNDWQNRSPVIRLNLYSFKKEHLSRIENLLEKELYTGSGKGGFKLQQHGIFRI